MPATAIVDATRGQVREEFVELLSLLLVAEEALREAGSKATALAASLEENDPALAAHARELSDRIGATASEDPTIQHARHLVERLLAGDPPPVGSPLVRAAIGRIRAGEKQAGP